MDGLVEHRFTAGLEWREVDGGVVVEGIAMPYQSEASIGGRFSERFVPGAFGDLAKSDVLVNMQHNRSRPLARSGGGGLVLQDGEDALRARVSLAPTQDGRDAGELLKLGILRGFSVEFSVPEGGERWDGSVREVVKASLRGIGIVDRPAYTDAVAQVALRAKSLESGCNRRRRVWL